MLLLRRNRDSSLLFSSSLCSLTPECASYFSIPLPSFHGRGVCLRPTLCARLPLKNLCNPVARGLKKRMHLVASRERERETLIFVNRRVWPGKNLSVCIFYPFSSPLYGQRFFCFQRFKSSFPSVVICRQGRGCCCILRGLGKGVCWMECLRPGGFVRVARSPVRVCISLSGNTRSCKIC